MLFVLGEQAQYIETGLFGLGKILDVSYAIIKFKPSHSIIKWVPSRVYKVVIWLGRMVLLKFYNRLPYFETY